MSLFRSTQSYLGIDFDANSVKVVELKNVAGRPQLVTYGYLDADPAAFGQPALADRPEVTARLIAQVCRKARTTTTKAITALPAYSVFSSILNLPVMPKKELANAVKWEAKKVIPLPVEEMILDWKLLSEFSGEQLREPARGGRASNGANRESEVGLQVKRRNFLNITPGKQHEQYAKILLTAAPKDLVKQYIDTFKAAGLTLLSLDTESFALIRSLVGNDKSAIMVVDIGALVTNISVVVNGIPIFNRSIDIGGMTITKAIANSLNISLDRAEQFKYDIGMSPKRVGQGSVPKTIEDTLTPIVDELKYSLNLYRSQGQQTVEKLVLTGGSSMLLNLPTYLANILSLKAYLGDPWARVMYPEELKPVLDQIGPRLSVAIGLAMRIIY